MLELNVWGICGLKWKKNSLIIDLLKQLEKTSFPQFESFIVEEEEGSGKQLPFSYMSSRFLFFLISICTNDVQKYSGGYGTVYRARRKKDGKRIAIKCKPGLLLCYSFNQFFNGLTCAGAYTHIFWKGNRYFMSIMKCTKG